LKLLNIPAWEALAAGLGVSGVPKTFQNRRVSSAAADATVHPSGLCSLTSKNYISNVLTLAYSMHSMQITTVN
jgi:hypothetical protein